MKYLFKCECVCEIEKKVLKSECLLVYTLHACMKKILPKKKKKKTTYEYIIFQTESSFCHFFLRLELKTSRRISV